MAPDTPRPIFVVGMDRSGTKWLSNEVSRHPNVVSIQHSRHTGIIESNMLLTLDERFDLSVPEEYVALIEMWVATDFVRTSGLGREFLYGLPVRPHRTVDLFRALMDEVARRRGSTHWLQKASPPAAMAILGHFPDARWVVIRRDVLGNLRSKMRLSERTGARRSLLRSVLGYVLEDKMLTRIERKTGACSVSFEELSRDPGRTLERVFASIGLPGAELAENTFDRNTSFSGGEDRSGYFSPVQERWIRMAAGLSRALPFALLRRVQRLVADHPVLVHGTYGDLLEERGLR